MRKLAIYVVSIVCLLVAYMAYKSPRLADKNLMLEMYSESGMCSASYIKSLNSKKTYIITAAHCAGLLDIKSQAKFVHEDGTIIVHHLVKIDTAHDLMILSSDSKVGLSLADKIMPNDLVYTLSHPHGKQLKYAQSKLDWYYPLSFGGLAGLLEGYTHFHGDPAPGSSGAPILDKEGKIVGILSAGTGDDATTFFVRLDDIKAFLHNVK